MPPPVLETSAAAPEESIPIPQNTKREPDVEEGKESNFPAHSPPESPLPEIEQYENLSVKLIYPYKEGLSFCLLQNECLVFFLGMLLNIRLYYV